jgi:hypothetical protein
MFIGMPGGIWPAFFDALRRKFANVLRMSVFALFV